MTSEKRTGPAKDVCTESDVKELLRRAMATMPGLKGLDIPIDRIPSDEEFNALNELFDADMDAFMADPANDIDALLAKDIPVRPKTSQPAIPSADAVPLSGTRRICIRVSARTIRAFKVKAAKTGVNYQTLMNSALNSAVEQGQ